MSDMKNQHRQLDLILKISDEDQVFLLKYFSKLPLVIKIELEKKKKKVFHFLREKYSDTDKSILTYAAHILSIKHEYSFEKKFSTKHFTNMSLDDIRNLSVIKLQKEDEKEYLSNSEKRNKLLHYWAVVRMYREHKPKPLSFVKISKKLKKHYNFCVSHNTIAVLWRELESAKNS